jgi:ABC-type dipeptide/oligopeptide/nickel transport system permease subunit
MTRLIALVVIVWLVIGAIAAGQRGYYGGNKDTSCAQAGDTVVTIVAGPLNYFGVNPKVTCHVPQPSK